MGQLADAFETALTVDRIGLLAFFIAAHHPSLILCSITDIRVY